LGLTGGRELDAYVPADVLDLLVSKYALAPPEDGAANAVLRVVPEALWPFGEPLAPVAAVALDLSQEPDARSMRVGRDALAKLDDRHLWRLDEH
jgi:hypothetical protein